MLDDGRWRGGSDPTNRVYWSDVTYRSPFSRDVKPCLTAALQRVEAMCCSTANVDREGAARVEKRWQETPERVVMLS
jgi:hypothetical protein